MNGDLKSVSGNWYVSTTQYGVKDYEFLGNTSTQSGSGITVTVTNEILGYTTLKAYSEPAYDKVHNSYILFKVPYYKVIVSGQKGRYLFRKTI